MDDGGKKENQSKMMQAMSTWEEVEESFKDGNINLKFFQLTENMNNIFVPKNIQWKYEYHMYYQQDEEEHLTSFFFGHKCFIFSIEHLC